MRLNALIAAAALACGGCGNYSTMKGVGAGLAVLGTGVAGYALVSPCLDYEFYGYQDVSDPDADQTSVLHRCQITALVGGLMFVGGLLLALGAQNAEHAQAREAQEAESRRVAPLIKEREKRIHDSRERAWRMTQEAAAAARLNDCATVNARAREVYDLDVELYETVFVRDVAIQRCLPPAPPPPPPPPMPAPPRDPIKDREQAFALVKTAKTAARAGNCAAVVELEGRVRALDPNVHDAWFVRDDAIKACLTAPTPASGSTPAPTLPSPVPAPAPAGSLGG